MFKRKKIEERFAELTDQYEELYEDSVCCSCDKYYNGKVDKYIERFKNCEGCGSDCKELQDLACRLDEVALQLEV